MPMAPVPAAVWAIITARRAELYGNVPAADLNLDVGSWFGNGGPDEPRRIERRCPDCWTWHAGDCL